MRIDCYHFENLLRTAAQREIALKYALEKTARRIEGAIAGPLTLENLAYLKEMARELRHLADTANLLDILPRPLSVKLPARKES